MNRVWNLSCIYVILYLENVVFLVIFSFLRYFWRCKEFFVLQWETKSTHPIYWKNIVNSEWYTNTQNKKIFITWNRGSDFRSNLLSLLLLEVINVHILSTVITIFMLLKFSFICMQIVYTFFYVEEVYTGVFLGKGGDNLFEAIWMKPTSKTFFICRLYIFEKGQYAFLYFYWNIWKM